MAGAEDLQSTADNIGSGIQQFMSGDIINALPMDKIFWWASAAFYVAIITFTSIYVYKYLFQFNKRALVRKLKGGNIVDHKLDRVKQITDEHGKKKLVFLAMKHGRERLSCPIPALYHTHKIGKNDFYIFDMDDKSNLIPVELKTTSNTKHMESPIEQEVWDSWSLDEKELAHERYKKKNFFSEHMSEILVIITVVACLLFGSFAIKTFGEMAATIGGALSQVANNCLG
jgi:hypothetical protein|tara:strand:- start:6779 stop:7465 length:687 start_codon:yes stop_codon:yes gene_type:complete